MPALRGRGVLAGDGVVSLPARGTIVRDVDGARREDETVACLGRPHRAGALIVEALSGWTPSVSRLGPCRASSNWTRARGPFGHDVSERPTPSWDGLGDTGTASYPGRPGRTRALIVEGRWGGRRESPSGVRLGLCPIGRVLGVQLDPGLPRRPTNCEHGRGVLRERLRGADLGRCPNGPTLGVQLDATPPGGRFRGVSGPGGPKPAQGRDGTEVGSLLDARRKRRRHGRM